MPRRQGGDEGRRLQREVVRPRGQPVEERLPHGGGGIAVEALEHHGDAQDVVAAEGHLLAPLRIEELLAIEGDEALDQVAVGGIRLGSHVHEHGAEELGQLARPEREPRDDAEAAAAAALQAPRTGPGWCRHWRCAPCRRPSPPRPRSGRRRPGRSAWRRCRSRRSGSGRPRPPWCSRRPARSGRPWRRRRRRAATPRRRPATPPAAGDRCSPGRRRRRAARCGSWRASRPAANRARWTSPDRSDRRPSRPAAGDGCARS